MPGAGKSTVLNEFAGDDVFQAAAAKDAVTGEDRAENIKKIQMAGSDGTLFDVVVEDTPGFPDTDSAKAAARFDHVVEVCNEEANGILVIFDPRRHQPEELARHKVTLREFVHLEAPLIVLMNGRESPGAAERRNPKKLEERQKKDIQYFMENGRDLVRVSGLQPMAIIPSWNLGDIPGIGSEIVDIMARTKAKPSNLRTLRQLKSHLSELKNAHSMAKSIREDCNRRLKVIGRDLILNEASVKGIEARKRRGDEIPFVGRFAGWVVKNYYKTKLLELQLNIARLEQDKQEVEKERESANDSEELARRVKLAEEELAEIQKYMP